MFRAFKVLFSDGRQSAFCLWVNATFNVYGLDPHCIKAWLAAYSSGTKLSFHKAHETLVRNFLSHSNYYRYDNSDSDDNNNHDDDDNSNNNNNAIGY